MYNGNRNQVLNCRVTEETLNKIDALRWDGKWSSRADIVEIVFQILSDDIEVSELKEFLYYRLHYRYVIPDKTLSIKER